MTFLTENHFPVFKVSKLTFLVKDEPLTSLNYIPDRKNFFLDTVIFGLVYLKNMNIQNLKGKITSFLNKQWPSDEIYLKKEFKLPNRQPIKLHGDSRTFLFKKQAQEHALEQGIGLNKFLHYQVVRV